MLFAQSLVHLGVDVHGAVNIIGFNHPCWFIANNGSILAGCMAAGIYTTNTPEACLYVTQHCKAEVLIVENNKQLEKYASIPNLASEIPNLKAVVVFGETPDEVLVDAIHVPVYTWEAFMGLGGSMDEASITAIQTRNRGVRPGNCALLIYTSGTTGPPKGAMISHDNITWGAKNVMEVCCGVICSDKILIYLVCHS